MENSKKWIKKNTMSLRTAASKLGIKTTVLDYQVEMKRIKTIDGRIRKSDYEMIAEQKSQFIGIKEFIKQHDSERFVAKLAKNRNKYIDFLEENNYFGATLYESNMMLFALPETEEFYLSVDDVVFIDFKSEKFFKEFGFTEKEKIGHILNATTGREKVLKYIENYINMLDDTSNIYTPSLTNFVEIIVSIGDVTKLSSEGVNAILDDINMKKTQYYVVGFLNYLSYYEKVKYGKIEIKKEEAESVSAYSYEKFVKLAKILFNSEYDAAHGLTKKALENHNFAEMWLFLSLHYVCGWRASDICEKWVYPYLKSSDNPFKINIDTLKEDILEGNIPEKTYESITLYSIKKIEMSFNLPNKTPNVSAGKLRSEIVPELRTFFGKLILIAEYHHITCGDGYMKAGRISTYCNWTYCRKFFGEDMYVLTQKNNISSRRLNKSYLQGMEQKARELGNTMLVSHIVASFARNHSNVDTIAIYLQEHGLTGETAEVVLFMMMQRGVLSVYLYNTLISAYPEQFEKLTSKEQTKIMSMIPVSACDLEVTASVQISSIQMAEAFSNGKTDEPKQILKTMYEIGQNKGKGKEKGVFCKKKALGESCVNPTYESCLANLCPYYVFTSDGLPSLLKVIKSYKEKADAGNVKYKAALKQKILPAFYEILNAAMEEMSRQEKESVKVLIREGLNA